MKVHLWLITLLIIGVGIASGQVATGTPPFASLGGGAADTVNLGNLNVHLAIPVVHKAGRGMPFDYSLSYDNSVWSPVTVNGVQQWQPAFNWGWVAQSAVRTGYLSYYVYHHNCDDGSGHQSTEYKGWTYYDSWGIVHRFGPGLQARLVYDPYNCALPPGTVSSMTVTAADGSGITINATLSGQGLATHTITARDGTVLNPPLNLTGGYSGSSSSATDANGNQISISSTSNSATFTDTLGTTAITVSGTSPVTFSYTAPSGSQQYTMNFQLYTVKTAFGFNTSPAISEYGRLSNSLVDNIQLPDGSKYTFTYEQTPGSCTPLPGTYQGHCVTGRLEPVS